MENHSRFSKKVEALCINDAMKCVVDKLKAIYRHLEVTGYAKYISFDLGFTNQMNYYSDLIFKGYINNWGEPVINGGRYNHLSEKFGISRPACGFGIDLLKMMEYMEQYHLLPQNPKRRKAVIFYSPEDKCEGYKSAGILRQKGQPTELFVLKKSTPEECSSYPFTKCSLSGCPLLSDPWSEELSFYRSGLSGH